MGAGTRHASRGRPDGRSGSIYIGVRGGEKAWLMFSIVCLYLALETKTTIMKSRH